MLRQLSLALGFGLLGALGAWPGERGPDPLAALAWIACLAFPLGLAAGALRLKAWPFAASVPALWMIALALAGALSERALPAPQWAALAWSGLFAAGWGLARPACPGPRTIAAAAVLSFGLAVLPSAGAVLGRPWPPARSARLLDLSPVTLAVESAGVDWMHHPAVYEPAGALDIDPGLRVAWNGKLAGPGLLLVGFGIAAFGAGRARRRERTCS